MKASQQCRDKMKTLQDDLKTKLISLKESLPGGNSVTVIWWTCTHEKRVNDEICLEETR